MSWQINASINTYFGIIRQDSISFSIFLYYSITKQQEGVRSMIGIRIAQLRRERGIKQAELADLLHISASAVGMYEQGRRLPSVNIIICLCQIFGVTADFLLTGKDA